MSCFTYTLVFSHALLKTANHRCKKLMAQLALAVQWILDWQQVIFRMRHQTDDIAPFIAKPGNVSHRTIGIERITRPGRLTVAINIAKGDQVVGFQLLQRLLIGDLEIAFAVGNRTEDQFIDGAQKTGARLSIHR